MDGYLRFICVFLFSCSQAFSQALVASLNFSDQEHTARLQYHEIDGGDTLLVAEFVYENSHVTSPARDTVKVPDKESMDDNIKNLTMFRNLIQSKHLAQDTIVSDYEFNVKFSGNIVRWKLTLDSVLTDVRYNRNNENVTVFPRGAINYTWSDFSWYVDVYNKHFAHVEFVERQQ